MLPIERLATPEQKAAVALVARLRELLAMNRRERRERGVTLSEAALRQMLAEVEGRLDREDAES